MIEITLTKTIGKNGMHYFYMQSEKRKGKKVRITEDKFYCLYTVSQAFNTYYKKGMN